MPLVCHFLSVLTLDLSNDSTAIHPPCPPFSFILFRFPLLSLSPPFSFTCVPFSFPSALTSSHSIFLYICIPSLSVCSVFNLVHLFLAPFSPPLSPFLRHLSVCLFFLYYSTALHLNIFFFFLFSLFFNISPNDDYFFFFNC